MKLIKIETKGFKSFSDKITLDFDGGIVGIVGPNGSGKSNINDAIKWVLGEQSIKNLRGDSFNDVIFSGSKLVQAAEKAQVTLTFDNTDNNVSIPHKKFSVSRIVSRGEGSSNYFINGEIARLKDIKEIAMESGIGKSSLAIISQGTISDIAEASPEERRAIFEEAAGISKYKARKKEALRKLDSTSDALDKVKTVADELEKQLNPLKRQAAKAKIYLSKKDELKDVEISLIVRDVNFFSKKLNILNNELEDVVNSKEDINSRISSLETEIEEKSSYKLNLENDVLKLSNSLQEISDKLRDIDVKSSYASQRRKMIIEGEIKIDDSSRLEAMKEELKDLSQKIHKFKIWEKKSLMDIQEKRTIISESQSKLTNDSFEIDSVQRRLLKLKTKHTILIDYRDNKTNLFKGVKTIFDNKELFSGYEGLVSEIINTKNDYKNAIESVLKSALQHIVVKTNDDAVKAVNFLKQNKGGRATFLPLNVIQPKGLFEQHEIVLKSQEGFIGIASSLVEVFPKYEILKKFLLGNIIIASTIETATSIAKLLKNKYMVVSLEGDIVRSGGVISGGEKSNSHEMLGIDKQIEKIEKAIPVLENIIKDKKNTSTIYSNKITEDQAIIAELNIEIAKVKEKKSIFESQYYSMKSTYESQSNKKFIESTNNIEESQDHLESEKSSINALLKAKRDSIMSINNDLSHFTISKTELEKSLRAIIESSSEKMTQKSQAEYVIKTSQRRLAEEYEMTIESASDYKLDIVEDLAREKVSILRSEIKELGHVNVDSIEAFEEVNTRFTKLNSSRQELFSAQQTIISAINEMDQIIISKLDKTINSVSLEFNNVFSSMFGGGHAEIRYTDPSNLLETGINVIAQPPGKTVRNLKLFSGGEKAMIAISLLFAILKARPLPLCILDEVEAALDEANVIRFAEYLQKLKHQTQFLVVTHRIGTMSRVDHLFGATMQKRGVTSFYTVKLSDAQKLINE